MSEEKKPVEFYEGMELPEEYRPKEMDRGTQTFWIVGAIVLAVAVFVYFQTRLPADDPHAKCQTLFGMDNSCKLANPDGYYYRN